MLQNIKQLLDMVSDPDLISESNALEKKLQGRPASHPQTLSSQVVIAPDFRAPRPYRFIPLLISGGAYKSSRETEILLHEIGGSAAIHEITSRFYEKAFRDPALSKFIVDPTEPHGLRLGNWIVEKMGGEGPVWTSERASRCPIQRFLSNGQKHLVHDRSSAHVAAWWSPKRPSQEAGDHFKVHDSRVWMRLMFWSAREAGVFSLSPTFEDWYIRFIAHFVRVYERNAPSFARESARWSITPKNLQDYEALGHSMGPEVLGSDGQGVPLDVALSLLPYLEAKKSEWPYQ